MPSKKIWDDPNPMRLENDPIMALREIAGYLRCITTRGRKVERLDGELEGYWQTPEFLQGCLDIADECDRICKKNEDIVDAVLSHALNEIDIPQFQPEGYRNGYLACIKKINEMKKTSSADSNHNVPAVQE